MILIDDIKEVSNVSIDTKVRLLERNFPRALFWLVLNNRSSSWIKMVRVLSVNPNFRRLKVCSHVTDFSPFY